MNTDFLFACRVCQSPLLAGEAERGAIAECPKCGASQAVPASGTNPSKYIPDAALVGDELPGPPRPLIRRVRLKRDAEGRMLMALTARANPRQVPRATQPLEETAKLKAEIYDLKQLIEEQNGRLSEWQTCHESVERELKRASVRAKAFQAKINETSNELAQTRHELKKLHIEADRLRKSNEALNRQIQGVLKAGRMKNQAPPSQAKKPARPKEGETPPGEIAA